MVALLRHLLVQRARTGAPPFTYREAEQSLRLAAEEEGLRLGEFDQHSLWGALDAIAATVIGGALLSGGVGYVLGTLTGVLMLGVIQTLIMFDGSLSSWWTRIAIGALLGLFCVLQRVMELLHRRRGGGP